MRSISLGAHTDYNTVACAPTYAVATQLVDCVQQVNMQQLVERQMQRVEKYISMQKNATNEIDATLI